MAGAAASHHKRFGVLRVGTVSSQPMSLDVWQKSLHPSSFILKARTATRS